MDSCDDETGVRQDQPTAYCLRSIPGRLVLSGLVWYPLRLSSSYPAFPVDLLRLWRVSSTLEGFFDTEHLGYLSLCFVPKVKVPKLTLTSRLRADTNPAY